MTPLREGQFKFLTAPLNVYFNVYTNKFYYQTTIAVNLNIIRMSSVIVVYHPPPCPRATAKG